jgi:cellobiose epimerase
MSRTISRRHLFRLSAGSIPLLGRMSTAKPPRSSAGVGGRIDAAWFQRMLSGEVENWLKAAATPNGFFQVTLDRRWQPVGRQIATLTSQNRQIFVMATGYELTRKPGYLEAMKKGAEFFLASFRDRQYGGLFHSVSPDGKALDERKDSYGTAFAIFGMSHAARVAREPQYGEAALQIWSDMKKNLRDRTGFFKPGTARDYSQTQEPNSQNPMMHLFEALLALHDATGSKEVYAEAEAHANAMFARGEGQLFQESGGYLPELYDSAWKPLPTGGSGRIELGHQFEWAFLLSHAVEKGFSRKYLTVGERLLDYGMKVAYDRENGGIFSTSDYDGRRDAGPKGWWHQCELLRALAHYAAVRGRKDLWEPFAQSLDFVKRNFIDAEYGGWYASYDPAKPREGRALNKGGAFQVGYHVCGMYVEALRLAGAWHPLG